MSAQVSNSRGASGMHNNRLVEVNSAISDGQATSLEDRETRSEWFLGILSAVWLASILTGMFSLWTYANTPGTQRTPLGQWPAETSLERVGDSPTLVMFAHPHCPCTRASMAELERIVASCREKLKVTVVFLKPPQFGAGWEVGELWSMASSIPGVQIHTDEGGVETFRFGADVSGLTVLYDTAGNMLFRGCITSGRGHEGDTNGRMAVTSLVTTGSALHQQTPVFGCRLQDTEFAGPRSQ